MELGSYFFILQEQIKDIIIKDIIIRTAQTATCVTGACKNT
jgi:hypothetical protein